MGRTCDDWLETYLRFTQLQESPDVFHLWCGMTVIASATYRQVYMDRAYYKLHPNLYVILVAESALSRKSTAIGIASKIYREADKRSNVLAQKTTPEALIQALKEKAKDTGVSSGLLCIDEMAVFLGQSAQDASLVHLLTKAYDCPDILDYRTVGRGVEEASQVYVNMLAGTTPKWFQDSLPKNAIEGGFTGRVIFVHQPPLNTRIAWPEVTERQRALRHALVEDLKYIATLSGAVEVTPGGRQWFKDYYDHLWNPDALDDSTGYMGRKPDTILKVSMILSVSRDDSLVVGQEHLEEALDLVNENEQHLPKIMQLIQRTETGELQAKVLSHIRKAKVIERAKLLRKVSYMMSAVQLSDVIASLEQAGRIQVIQNIEGRKTAYRYLF